MSTGLVKYERSEFAVLSPGSSAKLAMQENLVEGDSFSALDLVRVKTPSGGSTIWTIDSTAGPVHLPEIVGVLVYNCRRGLLWKSLEIGENDKPIVVSNDLIYGRLNVPPEEIPADFVEGLRKCEIPDRPGVYDWSALPWCQFGTGKKGQGKFAKESRMLYVLTRDAIWPLVIPAGPGSLGDVTRFIKRLEVPQYRAVVGLTLKEELSAGGIKYSKIVMNLKGVLGEEEGAELKEMYTDRLRADNEAGHVIIDRTE
jgi:hypothetical protein